MRLRDIRVYDPKKDGITYRTLIEMNNNGENSSALRYSLYERVLDSEISPGLKLENFLWGEGGFFSKPENVSRKIVFIEGRFSMHYDANEEENLGDVIDRLAQNLNAIPFKFSFDLDNDDFGEIEEEEVTSS